jgi:hypothetical protein
MATIHKEIEIERNKEFVWDAIRDVGAIHKRLYLGNSAQFDRDLKKFDEDVLKALVHSS